MKSTLDTTGRMTIEQYLSMESIVPEGYEMETMIVIGPYPAPSFFVRNPGGGKTKKDQQHSLAALPMARGAQLILVADDGVPSDRLNEIERSCARMFKAGTVILRAHESRLVHFKAYFVRWRHKSKDDTRATLLLGSANASLQGFGENSESFVEIDIDGLGTQKARNSALRYFEKIEKFAGGNLNRLQLKPVWFWLQQAYSSWVSMPALTITRSDHADPGSFDAWLLRGRLFHKFKPDQSFGKIRIVLAKKPPKTALDDAAERSGFSMVGNRATIAARYVSDVATEDDDEGEDQNGEQVIRPRWLSQLFVETRYGYWTSEACFAELKDYFVSQGADKRRQLLERVKHASEADVSKWVNDVLDSLRKLREELRAEPSIGEGADAYFSGSSSFESWLEQVGKRADDKIREDKVRATEPEFRDRFERGFESFKVPSLGDEAEEFAQSFCANVLYWWSAKQATNWFSREAAGILETGDQQDKEFDRKSLAEYFRACWNSNKSATLRRFHDGWKEED